MSGGFCMKKIVSVLLGVSLFVSVLPAAAIKPKEALDEVEKALTEGKDNVEDFLEEAGDKIKEVSGETGDKIKETYEGAKDAIENLGDKAKDEADQLKDDATDAADKAGETVDEAQQKILDGWKKMEDTLTEKFPHLIHGEKNPFTPEFVLQDKKVNAPPVFYTKEDVLMVPLRALAEGLGYEIGWDEKTQNIRVGLDATLTIGNDSYTFARRAPILLGQEPILHEGVTYVPITYFTEVLGFTNAYYENGQVVINDNVSDLEE